MTRQTATDTVTLTADKRAAWAAFAAHCYRTGQNALGHKASAGSAIGRVAWPTYDTVTGAMVPVMAQRVGTPDFLTAAQESAILAEIEECYQEAVKAAGRGAADVVEISRAAFELTEGDCDWIAQSGDADAAIWGTLTWQQRNAMMRVWRGAKAAEAAEALARR